MARFHTLVFFALSFLTCKCAGGRNGDVKKLGDGKSLYIPRVEEVNISTSLTKDFDGKGLEPWYDVAKSFVHTVQKDDLPYDDIEKGIEGNFEVAEFLKGWELPFLVVFAIGILFAIIVPIVGLCFCCCRCCGNCGGEMTQKLTSKRGLKRHGFGIALSIITLLMFTGCLMAFVSNDRITDTVESYKTTPIRAIRDAEKYFNGTLNVVTSDVIDNVLSVLKIVGDDVHAFPNNMYVEVEKNLSDSVKAPLESVIKLANATKRMGVLLKKINITTKQLQTRSTELEKNITKVKKDLNTTCDPSAVNCSGFDYESILTIGADFSALPDVTQQLNNIADINNNNLTGNAEKGLKEYKGIKSRILKESSSSIHTIEANINNTREKFTNEILGDINDKVNELVLDKTDGWVKDIEDYLDDYITPYDKYRYSAGVGLTCLVLLPVVLMALGLLCGIFGYKKDAGPTERGAISNMGGNFLMAAVGFMFIFVFFLMLFCAICFILGAHLEKGCHSVREETLYKDFFDVPKYWDGDYLLGERVFNDGKKNLTIEGILSSCRNNDAIFQAIKGYLKWNLSDKFSVKDKLGDIEKNLEEFDVDVTNQTILEKKTKDGLTDLQNSGVNNIDFEQFFNETRKGVLNEADVNKLQTDLRDSMNANLTNVANDLDGIKKEAESMQNLSTQLEKDVEELKSLGGNISNLANQTLKEAEAAERIYKSQVPSAVTEAVNKFKNQILNYINQISEWATKAIEKDIGRCRILTDVYDAAVNLVCRETVYPFNGFWFALGFCLFFYIPAIILSVKLAKHYRRMRFEHGFDEGFEMANVQERNKPWLNQGNTVYPK